MGFKYDGFGERLWQAGGEQTVRGLARKLDVPETSLQNWLREIAYPNVASLINICEKLNVSIDWLIGFEVKRKPEKKKSGSIFK